MRFEWDENKNRINITKHGISFERALTIFAGEVLSFTDTRHNYGERRIVNIGKMDDTVIAAVITTDRKGNKRIISARVASKKDRRLYREYKTQT